MSEARSPSSFSSPSSPPRTPLTPSLISTFGVARVHRTHHKPVACMDFSMDGGTLAASSPDGLVSVYDTLDGTQTAAIPVHKYGAGVIRFIHTAHPPALVAASALQDNHLRLLDLQRETYMRYFRGHDDVVTSVSASPAGPGILSASRDAWVRVWDCRQEAAVGKLRAMGVPVVAYDPKGLIFSIAYNVPGKKTMVKLFDARQYDDGPFLEFQLENASDAVPTCLKFSSDGEYFLLVNADVNAEVAVYDAYKGAPFRKFAAHRNVNGVSLEASFSPDSAYVATGSDDGSLFVWDLRTEQVLVEKKSVHALPSTSVVWNPVYQMMASACQNVLFWLPQQQDASSEY